MVLYKDLLDKMYKDAIESDCVAPESKLEFIGNHIFDFTTYSSEIDVILAKRMLSVCSSILYGTTFDFIGKSDDNHIEFILMCNMPFLKEKIDWGTSIRGAFFSDDVYKIDNEYDIYDIKQFISDLISWSNE